MDKIKILMLGESLDRSGGIVSVQKLILNNISDRIEIACIATLRDGSKLYKILVFIQAVGLLCWRLLTSEVDVVHIHVAERGSAFRQACTATIAWLFRKPVILHNHSADFHVFYDNLLPIVRFGLSWAFRRSTRFIVLSHSWQKFYVENLGLAVERTIVLPNPVKSPVEIPPRINSEIVNFLFLGKIGDRKGAFDLIAAFAALPSEKQQYATLTMAGDGEVQKAKDTIEKLKLERHVTILNWVNEEQRNELLKNANVFVLPSYNEGLPMALLEAMSWGLPTISTPVGGIPEVVISQKNGLSIEPGNIKQLSDAMQSLIDSEALRIRLGNAASKSVSPFEISKYCDRLADIFVDCLSDTNKNRIGK
jgi:glycosyltransferase involved in cell wall biosynthesis